MYLLSCLFVDITPKTNLKYGDMVRVKFENKLFRANVVRKSGETYTAFLIDIGRQVEVIAKDIYEISDYLKKVSIHSVLCV